MGATEHLGTKPAPHALGSVGEYRLEPVSCPGEEPFAEDPTTGSSGFSFTYSSTTLRNSCMSFPHNMERNYSHTYSLFHSWFILLKFNLVGQFSQTCGHVSAVERVISLATLLFDRHDTFLRKHLEVT